MSDDFTGEKTWLAEKIEDPETRVAFSQEWASFRFCEQVEDALETLGLTRADLAKRLNVSRAAITQALSEGESRNFTLETMARYAVALDFDLDIVLRPSNASDELAVEDAREANIMTMELARGSCVYTSAGVANSPGVESSFNWLNSLASDSWYVWSHVKDEEPVILGKPLRKWLDREGTEKVPAVLQGCSFDKWAVS